MSDAYNRSRYERARADVRREVEAEFDASAPVKMMELAERFVIAIEAIAKSLASRPADQEQTP
jgi:hypothetical protein